MRAHRMPRHHDMVHSRAPPSTNPKPQTFLQLLQPSPASSAIVYVPNEEMTPRFASSICRSGATGVGLPILPATQVAVNYTRI